jgi:hypothetical protein
MASYIAGEKDGVTKWHEVDEAGPDPDVLQMAQGVSMNKSKCGVHYGSDQVPEATDQFPLCEDC